MLHNQENVKTLLTKSPELNIYHFWGKIKHISFGLTTMSMYTIIIK